MTRTAHRCFYAASAVQFFADRSARTARVRRRESSSASRSLPKARTAQALRAFLFWRVNGVWRMNVERMMKHMTILICDKRQPKAFALSEAGTRAPRAEEIF